MRKTIVIVIVTCLIGGQRLRAINDSLHKMSVYVNLSKCIADDILGSGNVYAVFGFNNILKKNILTDVALGPIVYHSTENNFLGINQQKMNGFFMSVEVCRLMNKFYVGGQMFQRHTKSSDSDGDRVRRTTGGIAAIAGRMFYLQKTVTLNLSLGLGIKRIRSVGSNPEKNHSIKEFPSGKYYYSGTGFFPAVLFDLKICKKF